MELRTIGMGAFSILAMVFSACTSNDEFEELNGSSTDINVIGFRVQNPTRSTSSGSYASSVSNFRVSAIDEGENYFGTTPLSVSTFDRGNTWTANKQQSWPLNRPADWKGLTFVAYAGDNSDNASFRLVAGEASFDNYVVPSDVNRQADLLYAVAKDVKKSSLGGDVNLQFRHALSQITFTAQNNNPVYESIEILSIEVGGVKGKGTYLFPAESTDGSTTTSMRTASLSRGNWTIDKNSADRTFSIENPGTVLPPADDSCRGKKVTVKDSSDSEMAMYLMPQVANALEEGREGGAYIKVTTRMVIKGCADNSFTSEEIIPIDVNWKEGQKYSYNIVWNAVPITFGVTISDFRDVSVTTNN